MSQSHSSPRPRRRPQDRESATTAVGLAAERVVLALRERERRTAHSDLAARRLGRRAQGPKP
jgi:hypothetical protein